MKELSLNPRAVYQRAYRKLNPHVNKGASKRYHQKIREQVIEAMGGECCQCGYSDKRALHIDHKNADGGKIRGRTNNGWSKMYHEIIKGLGKEKYQLLCANCNWIKKHDGQEY